MLRASSFSNIPRNRRRLNKEYFNFWYCQILAPQDGTYNFTSNFKGEEIGLFKLSLLIFTVAQGIVTLFFLQMSMLSLRV